MSDNQQQITRKDFIVSLLGILGIFFLKQLPFSSFDKRSQLPKAQSSFGSGPYGG